MPNRCAYHRSLSDTAAHCDQTTPQISIDIAVHIYTALSAIEINRYSLIHRIRSLWNTHSERTTAEIRLLVSGWWSRVADPSAE